MSVPSDRLRRLGGIAGLLFVALAIVALFLPGMPPKADEASKVASYLTDKRSSILAGNYLLGVGTVFFLIFAGALRTQIGASDRSGLRPGAPLVAAAGAAAALLLGGAAVINGAAFRAHGGDVDVALYDVGNALFFMSSFAFAAFFLASAVSIGVTGALPQVLSPAALVIALLSAVSGVGLFAKSGFFATGGAFGFIGPLLSLLWVLAVSVIFLRGAPATATSTTTTT